jgi:hypothetical protein
MAFDENNYETMPSEGDDLPEESNNNRTFMIVAGILGGLILISLACVAGFILLRPTGTTAPDQAAAANATQTAISAQKFINQALTATFQASILPTATLSPMPTSTPPVGQPSATPTLNPALPSATATGASVSGTQIAATSTVAAALTQAAAAQKTVVALPSPTALAGTGIADEYGLPGLFVMALAFIIVILFARKLRVAPAR